jgi:DNA-binding GntR family transcriptional regulator
MKYPLLGILEKKLHIPVIEVRQVIEAAVADTEVAKQLEVSFGSPLLYVERTLLGEKGTPVGFTQAHYRGDGYRLSVTLVKGDGNIAKSWRSSA